MKKLAVIVILCAASMVSIAAQGTPAEHSAAGAILEEWVMHAEKEIVPAAAAMPEDKFAFVPSDGEFGGVRTFAEQAKHLAAANYQLAARILGQKPPHGEQNETAPASLKTKAEIVDYLQGSFAYLRKAVATVNEDNLVDPIAGTRGTWQRTRLGIAIDALAHSYDHYGQMVEYLRMNGIIPPASR